MLQEFSLLATLQAKIGTDNVGQKPRFVPVPPPDHASVPVPGRHPQPAPVPFPVPVPCLPPAPAAAVFFDPKPAQAPPGTYSFEIDRKPKSQKFSPLKTKAAAAAVSAVLRPQQQPLRRHNLQPQQAVQESSAAPQSITRALLANLGRGKALQTSKLRRPGRILNLNTIRDVGQDLAGRNSSADSSVDNLASAGTELETPNTEGGNRTAELQDCRLRLAQMGQAGTSAGKCRSSLLDELLKPETEEEKKKNEALDEMDRVIAAREEKRERESAQVQADIAEEKLRQEERRKRLAENAKLRDRLEIEITEEELKKLFAKNRVYFEGIWDGSVESSRHKAFHQSRRTRHALTYMMITDPFTDGKPE